ASKIRGKPIPSFTIKVKAPKLDETNEASIAAKHIGTQPVIVDCGADEVLNTYPRLIQAAEGPVIDTSCVGLLLLAQEVHRQGYKVAQTGEGADEWLAGYPWHKINRALSWLDVLPGMTLSQMARRFFLRVSGAPRLPWALVRRGQNAVAGHTGW